MPNKEYHTAEYEALHRVITADKRLRMFQYMLTFVFFLLVVLGGIQVQHNITSKIDELVDGSVARGNARALEQKTIAKETTRYITCIFVIPIEHRTSENQQRCFDEADLPGGLTREDFSPYVAITNSFVTGLGVTEEAAPRGASNGASTDSSSTSSPKNTPTPTTPQSNNIQPVTTPPNCTIDILFVHVGRCD